MYRRLTLVTLSVFLLAGTAQAVGWTQPIDISAKNVVEWGGGVGSATHTRHVTFVEKQSFDSAFCGMSVLQKSRGTIHQTATIDNETGPASIRQTASVVGSQYLPRDPRRSFGGSPSQSLDVTLRTHAVKPYGVGTVEGRQSFIGGQTQTVTTPYGVVTQSQCVNVREHTTITTTTDTDPSIKSSINIRMDQNPGVPR